MSTCTRNKRFPVTHDAIKTFINNGPLTSIILNNKYALMPIIKFASFDRNGYLRIVIGGKCPNCQSNHIRNICNVRYCQELLLPILKKRFQLIKHIFPVFTYDKDLEDIVKSTGGE